MAHGLKSLSVGEAAVYTLPLERIREKPGFNLRRPGPAMEANIEALRAMYVNGKAQFLPPLVVRLTPGETVAYIVEGHQRYQAAMRAATLDGVEIRGLPCISSPRGMDANELTAIIYTSQSGLKLTTLEKVDGIKRMLGGGWTMDQIAKNINVSTQAIQNWLTVAEAPQEIQDMVSAGQVAPTEVVKLIREEGEVAATATLQLAVEEVKAAGKEKVTAKTIRHVQAAVGGGAPPVRKTAASVAKGSKKPLPGVEVAAPGLVAPSVVKERGGAPPTMKEAIEAFLNEWEDPTGADDSTLDAAINGLREVVGRGVVVPVQKRAA